MKNRQHVVRHLAPLVVLLMFPAVADGAHGGPAGDPEEMFQARLLLSRATYGARPGDLDTVLTLGVDQWLERQLNPEEIDDSTLEARLSRFEDLHLTTAEMLEKYPRPDRQELARMEELRRAADSGNRGYLDPDLRREMMMRLKSRGSVVRQLSEAKLLRAVESERQLLEVMTDFWFNHFNVYAGKNRLTALFLPSYEAEAIRPHALGTFYDLLLATAQHPAMLIYLDNWTNAREGFDPAEEIRSARARRRFDRRAGRASGREKGRRTFGLNENYGRELLELHTLGVDGGYDQHDVVEVARCFTGWTTVNPDRVFFPGNGRRKGGGVEARMDGRFNFIGAMHDPDTKYVLGRPVTAGGLDDGLSVLRMLSRHPSTAWYISTKLAQRFVCDEPSRELVTELSTAFLKSDGDIRHVLGVLFRSPRFVTEGLASPKVKTPLELVASSLRAVEATMTGGGAVARKLGELGMPLYRCPPPTGYDEEGEPWLSAGAMIGRFRFVGELLFGIVPGVRLPAPPQDAEAWARAVTVSGDVLPAETAVFAASLGPGEIRQAMVLVLAGPAFQMQ